MTDKPFAEAIRCGCGKLRVGSMRVAAEYGDQAEATAARIQSDHAALVAAARKEERERCAKLCDYHAKGEEPGFGSFSRAASVIRALGDG